MHFVPWLMVNVLFTLTPLGVNANCWLGLPVHLPTLMFEPPSICRHWLSITEVMVPVLVMLQAPLQSHGEAQFFGSALHPQLQFTAAPSPVLHASISMHASFGLVAKAMFVVFASPGATPGDKTHDWLLEPASHFLAEKAPCGGPGGPGEGVLHSL